MDTRKRVVVQGGLALMYPPVAAECRERLMFKKYNYGTNSHSPLRCFTETPSALVVPRHFPRMNEDLGPFEYQFSVSDGLPLPGIGIVRKELKWRGVDQAGFIREAVVGARRNGLGGYLISPCGTGKTLMGLEIARQLGRRTLVVLSRRFQPTQWAEELEQSFVGGRYGIYQGKRRDRDAPFVFGVINTLLKERDPKFYEQFGTVLFDEGHHLPANTWMGMVARLRSRYIFALTASFHRTDGLDKLFRLLLGETVAEASVDKVEGGLATMVYLPPYLDSGRPWGSMPNRKQWATKLGRNEGRNRVVVKTIIWLGRTGREMLVFSDVREHLSTLHEMCLQAGVPPDIMGFYIGGMDAAALKEGGKKQITFITYDMGSESLNLPHKDSAVCATPPVSNLKQLKGRIDRALPDPTAKKHPPQVVDFVDPMKSLHRKGRSRELRWVDEGLTVKTCYGG